MTFARTAASITFHILNRSRTKYPRIEPQMTPSTIDTKGGSVRIRMRPLTTPAMTKATIPTSARNSTCRLSRLISMALTSIFCAVRLFFNTIIPCCRLFENKRKFTLDKFFGVGVGHSILFDFYFYIEY